MRRRRERSCLSLVWAVLDRASRGWRGVDQRPANVRLLQQLRHQLLDPPSLELQGGDAPAEPSSPPRNIRHPEPLRPAAFTPSLGRHLRRAAPR